jgi:hypothetical protein
VGHASRSARLASLESKLRYDFPVWPQDWQRHDSGWCTWHHRGDCVESKLKTDGSIRWAASDPGSRALPFSIY